MNGSTAAIRPRDAAFDHGRESTGEEALSDRATRIMPDRETAAGGDHRASSSFRLAQSQRLGYVCVTVNRSRKRYDQSLALAGGTGNGACRNIAG